MNQKDKEISQKAVVYISRIPYGFQEKAAFEFFQQFGDIEGICYPRSKKTGRSKGYMFILFSDRDVAIECAKSVDNYYMFGKSLKTVVLPENHKIIQSRFAKNPRKFKFVPWQTIFKKNFNTGQTDEKMKKKIRKLLRSDQNKKERFEKLGIDFEFIEYKDLVSEHQLIQFKQQC